jgi:hypothetical protein
VRNLFWRIILVAGNSNCSISLKFISICQRERKEGGEIVSSELTFHAEFSVSANTLENFHSELANAFGIYLVGTNLNAGEFESFSANNSISNISTAGCNSGILIFYFFNLTLSFLRTHPLTHSYA